MVILIRLKASCTWHVYTVLCYKNWNMGKFVGAHSWTRMMAPKGKHYQEEHQLQRLFLHIYAHLTMNHRDDIIMHDPSPQNQKWNRCHFLLGACSLCSGHVHHPSHSLDDTDGGEEQACSRAYILSAITCKVHHDDEAPTMPFIILLIR